MSSEGLIEGTRKPRLLCLHGFRTSGRILETQLQKWPQFVLDKLDLFFPDAPYPAVGKSHVDGLFDPPYYEWLSSKKEVDSNKKHMQEFVYTKFDETIKYIEDSMIKHRPIDGLLGFSQGSVLSAALVGLQAKGLALTKVPKLKFLIIISGAKLRNEAWVDKAFSDIIRCPSLHFLGELDYLKSQGTELLESFVDPVVIHHREGHTVPSLDEKGLKLMLSFLLKMQNEVANQEKQQKCSRRSSL
ncbi:uncharacterized protein LOC108217683 [Daucus carota subsp. sativus]|uniref:uncharacterized protein LOC108217683 n=1 Tax=Daucus carota subsp. sativus TaxID=79200 RepID=UPI0007EFAEB2|nr:PREDICTED: esterase AGAP003155-like isoform X1 [Daucus carota subsp. sativus]